MDQQSANEILYAYQNVLRQQGVLSWIDELARRYPDAEVHLVGGAVRDCVLGRPDAKDYDFVVRNVASDALESVLKKFGTVNYVGKAFGVFKLKLHEPLELEALDVALPRTEQAWGTGKYKDVDTQSDPALPLDKDLARRDFTVNAIAMRVMGGRGQLLVDNYNGLNDAAGRLLRAVGDPHERFNEDYSRMLRGLRFAANLGFEIEQATWDALVATLSHLNDQDKAGVWIVPRETIASEFLRALGGSPVRAFDLYEKSGAFSELMPELDAMKDCPQPVQFHSEGDVWTHTRLALAVLESEVFAAQFREPILTQDARSLWNAEIALAVLLHDIGKPSTLTTPERDGTDRIRFNDHDQVGAQMAGAIIDRLKLTSPEGIGVDVERMKFIIRHHLLFLHGKVDELRPTTIEKYFFADPVRGEEFLKLCFADGAATVPADGSPTLQNFHRMVARINTLKERGRKTLPPALLTGYEIMELLSIPSGKAVGEVLEQLREAQLEGKINNPEEARAFLTKYGN